MKIAVPGVGLAATPPWWYATEPTAPARLLRPFAALWSSLATRRLARHEHAYRSRLPVICVGNFTAGGAGKTPVALYIGSLLVSRGIPFAYLTRGYGGRVRGPHLVDIDRDTALEVGDEALLLAGVAPTLVARNRADGARAIESRAEPAELIVLDDGLQNPSLAKTLTFAVVDAGRGLGNGLVMPAGPLRAPLAPQLALTDAIIVLAGGGAGPLQDDVAERLRETFPGPVLAATIQPVGETGWLRGRPVVAYAGIADPNKLFTTVKALGADVVATVAFPDHHPFREAEARRLLDRADAAGAQLVTTEKDWVRLKGATGARGELSARSRPLAVRVAMAPGEETRLLALLDGAIPRARKDACVPPEKGD